MSGRCRERYKRRVMEVAAEYYRRALVRWVDTVRRWAWLVFLAALVVTAGTAYFVVTHMKIDTDTSGMLAQDLPFMQRSNALSDAFPQYSDNILVVVDGDTADLAEDAALALAEEMRRRPGLFGDVFYPEGDPFFRKNGLLYLDVDELLDLSDRLAQAQPFLGTLWSDPSLRGLFEMLGLAIDEVLKGDQGTPMEIAGILEAISGTAEAQAAGRFGLLSWREQMMGAAGDTDDRRQYIVIQPILDFGSLQPATEAMEWLRRITRELDLDPGHGVRVRLTGSAALAQEELKSVEEGMGLAAILSLTLVVGLLLIGLKSPRLIAATLITLVMGLEWTAGFALLAVGQLNLISVAFAVLFIGLSVDFGIHFGLRYREAFDGGEGHDAALRQAAEGVGGALTLCAVAAAIGFFSFLPTDYVGLAELGLIAGVGMFIALFSNLTVLPALMTLMPPSRRKGRGKGKKGGKAMFRWSAVVQGYGRPIVIGATVLGVAAATQLPRAGFDFDPMNLRDPSTESVSTLLEIMEDTRTGSYSITVLADNLEAASAMGEEVARLDLVDGTRTLADYLPGRQEEKLEIIGDMALFLGPAFTARPKAPPLAEDRRTALADLRIRLQELERASVDAPTRSAGARLLVALSSLALSSPPDDRVLEELETRLLASLPNRLRSLGEALNAEPVTMDDLPRSLKDREVAADGRARLKVFPRENLHDREALRRFVGAVLEILPEATGSTVVILEAGNTIVGAFRDAAVMAVVAILLLLAILLRSFRDVALVFAPLVLAALLTVAASVLLDLPFNFANVIVLPLLFGLGVANGIHLVLRERDEAGVSRVLETSTPRAMVFSAFTTMGSFGSIALSSHPGTASMGALLTIAITMTLVCTLVVLPALMAIVPVAGTGK